MVEKVSLGLKGTISSSISRDCFLLTLVMLLDVTEKDHNIYSQTT